MLCFAAFTPHSPLLIETIGKENLKHLADTRAAFARLSADLEASAPDTLIVVSAHSTVHASAFSINLHDEYSVDLREFGDHTTYAEFAPDLELITAVQRRARDEELPFVLESSRSLEYGSGVPLLLLCTALQPRIIPVSYSGHDRKQHLAFGRLLKDVAIATGKRVAVIASGDLSHTLTSDAPMGFRKEGQAFDEALRRSVEQLSASTMLTLEEEIVERSEQCALRPWLVLLGLLERMQARPEVLSYEAPFGVGYLVAEFHL
ncbi:AmmeMemoRadiSam system protein B [Candidatus Parcubacteria bacterium]|nr:AmmeMemoRadiSam system protein B [Candidatus Parcubacteria bacterium]